MGLEVTIDAIGNLSMTLPGQDRTAPRILIGSHLDSVPQGGNFDGATGVVAGLSALSAMRRAGVVPDFDLSVMAIRAEESAWFDVAYLGSAGAFGLLDPACLSTPQIGQRPDSGGDAARSRASIRRPIRERRRLLDPSGIRAYLELHIEQGPTLVARGVARRRRQRHPRLQAVPQRALHRRLRPLGSRRPAPTGRMRSQRP